MIATLAAPRKSRSGTKNIENTRSPQRAQRGCQVRLICGSARHQTDAMAARSGAFRS